VQLSLSHDCPNWERDPRNCRNRRRVSSRADPLNTLEVAYSRWLAAQRRPFSKSRGVHSPCGFDSLLRHQQSTRTDPTAVCARIRWMAAVLSYGRTTGRGAKNPSAGAASRDRLRDGFALLTRGRHQRPVGTVSENLTRAKAEGSSGAAIPGIVDPRAETHTQGQP